MGSVMFKLPFLRFFCDFGFSISKEKRIIPLTFPQKQGIIISERYASKERTHMDWKEIQEGTKALTDIAAQKINEMSDLASLHLKLKTAEYRLRVLYEELGKTAFEHFTTENSRVDRIKKFVEAITVEQKSVSELKLAIRRMQEKPAEKATEKATEKTSEDESL
jgi:hypothetical protein